ncbi:hypothetical protein [Oceanisphaera arctica]|uniref:Uncharacterized protein n=1 Tax=Oceanisphaera arctica TaxID=641510 RepID=A0A2P5THR3_9GAMM|nr:hypothetical protein [Oceanisphaera arctica]PPL14068.1 hypothetical protein UN63_16735 [Oceanisphaera arctica]GHA05504.1 hypothetical protein GCM10007082_03060 [Oceanisphaera arctica]
MIAVESAVGSRLNMLCVISGYNWNNGSNAGPWGVNLNNNRTNSNNNVGFAADSNPHLKHPLPGATGIEGGDFPPQAKPYYAPLSGSNCERQWGAQ